MLGPTAIAHSDIAAGFSSSVTSQVAGPSGSISHTAVAIDPVYGSQFTGLASIDNTQAGGYPHKYGGGLCWHGSNGPNGSTGPASRYRRPAKLGDDTALTGQSSQQWLASMGILSWKWRCSRPQQVPLAHRPCRTKCASSFRVPLT